MLTTASTLAMMAAAAIGAAPSANASATATDSVSIGANYASYDISTGWFEVCDMERDGNGVYIKFSNSYGGSEGGTYGDSNGSAGGCGNGNVKGYKYMAICEDSIGWDSCVSENLDGQ
ncbi:hypothetical protein ACWGDE_30405 [Streptomyces sp. NPDC054956]